MAKNIEYGVRTERPWCPTIEVRSTGPGTFEARTKGGEFAAIGNSRKDAVANLRGKLPPHEEPVIENIPVPAPFPERHAWERTIE
jgi:hypothetical protein